MPTWPTNKPDSNRFNSDSDSIKQSRTELKTMSDAVNDIVDFVDTTNIADQYILMYNTSNGRLEPAKFDSSTTIDTDSAGGPNIVRGLGGVSNPLTADLITRHYRIGNDGGGSGSPVGNAHISFTQGQNVNMSSFHTTTAPDITIQNFNSDQYGLTNRTGNKFSVPDYGAIRLFAQGPTDSKDDSGGWSTKSQISISQVGVYERGSGVNISYLSQDYDAADSAGTINDSAGADSVLQQFVRLGTTGLRLQTTNGGTNWTDAHRSIHVLSEKSVIIHAPKSDDSGGVGLPISNPADDPGNIDLQADQVNFYSNAITLDYTKWPATDGSSGQFLQTNGSGQLSWVTASGTGTMNDVIDDITPQLGGDLDLNSNNITGTGNINTTGTISLSNTTTSDSLLITTTEDTSTAAPVITLKRQSASPADADYLGQLKFQGENDADQEVVYAKITAKIGDASDTTEDGIIEFALQKAGSNNIGVRLTSTDLKLINGTGLEVAGNTTLSGTLNNHTIPSGSGTLALTSDVGDSIQAGDNILINQPDSSGAKSIHLRFPLNQPVDGGDQQLSNLSIKNYGEIVYTSGATTGTITPDPSNGSVQKITLTGSITLNSLSNVASGDSLTLIVKQPSSGGPYTLTSTMKFSGANKTLSTGANEIDIITIFYDGTDYLASLSTNFS